MGGLPGVRENSKSPVTAHFCPLRWEQSFVSTFRSSNRTGGLSRIRLSDKTSRLHPRHVVPKSAQPYEPEVPVKMREWMVPPLHRLTLCLMRNHRRNRAAL
jgi:hypothetical protein